MHLQDLLPAGKAVWGILHPATLSEAVQTGAGWDLEILQTKFLFLSIRKAS